MIKRLNDETFDFMNMFEGTINAIDTNGELIDECFGLVSEEAVDIYYRSQGVN